MKVDPYEAGGDTLVLRRRLGFYLKTSSSDIVDGTVSESKATLRLFGRRAPFFQLGLVEPWLWAVLRGGIA
jgi:hypothetical protein